MQTMEYLSKRDSEQTRVVLFLKSGQKMVVPSEIYPNTVQSVLHSIANFRLILSEPASSASDVAQYDFPLWSATLY